MKKILCLILVTVMLFSFTACSSQNNQTSADLFSFEFKLDGLNVKIPESISAFTDDGWTFFEDFNDFDSTLSSGSLETTYLSKGDNWIFVEIFNNSGSDLAVKDCKIGRITYDFSGDLQLYLAGDYLLNDKTLEEFTSTFGEPMSKAEYSTYYELIYDKNEDEGIYDRYTLRFNKQTGAIKLFDVVNFYHLKK